MSDKAEEPEARAKVEPVGSAGFNTLDVLGHLGSGFGKGVYAPVKGAVQLVTGDGFGIDQPASSASATPTAAPADSTSSTYNAYNARAEQLGEFAGQAFDFIVASKLAKSSISRFDQQFARTLVDGAAEKSLTARAAASLERKAAITAGGALGFLAPTQNGGSDLVQRGKNALMGAGTVTIFETTSAFAASKGLGGTLGKDAWRAGLSGVVAGSSTVELQARINTGHNASLRDIVGSGGMWGLTGAVLHVGGVGAGKVAETFRSTRTAQSPQLEPPPPSLPITKVPPSVESTVLTESVPAKIPEAPQVATEAASESVPKAAPKAAPDSAPEVVHRDGHYYDNDWGGWIKDLPDVGIIRYPSGASSAHYSGDVVASLSADGKPSATLSDGTRWQDFASSGIQAHAKDGTYYREDKLGSWTIKRPGVEEINHHADGTEIVKSADGKVVDTWPDGTRRIFEAEREEPGRPVESTVKFEALKDAMEKAGVTPEMVAAAGVPENLMGQGGNANVYDIPGLPDYVLRKGHWGGESAVPENPTMGAVADPIPGENIGQPVANLSDRGGQILLRQTGEPAGGPVGRKRRSMEPEAANELYVAKLEEIAAMPQSAYDQFAATLLRLREHGLAFDPSKANNVLVDSQKQTFNVVDINAQPGTYPDASYMSTVLLDPGFANGAKGLVRPNELYHVIVQKVFTAADHTGLPVSATTDYAWLTGRHLLAERNQRAAQAYEQNRPDIFKRMEAEVEELLKPLFRETPPADLTKPAGAPD